MKHIEWSTEKNEWLKLHRAICFEDVFPYIVEDKEKIFLKTVIPSRRYTKKYLKEGK